MSLIELLKETVEAKGLNYEKWIENYTQVSEGK